MKLGAGEKGTMSFPVGKEVVFTHNKPVTYQVITSGGSRIEVELPAGVEIKLTNLGDIENVNINFFDSPNGPTEIVN